MSMSKPILWNTARPWHEFHLFTSSQQRPPVDSHHKTDAFYWSTARFAIDFFSHVALGTTSALNITSGLHFLLPVGRGNRWLQKIAMLPIYAKKSRNQLLVKKALNHFRLSGRLLGNQDFEPLSFICIYIYPKKYTVYPPLNRCWPNFGRFREVPHHCCLPAFWILQCLYHCCCEGCGILMRQAPLRISGEFLKKCGKLYPSPFYFTMANDTYRMFGNFRSCFSAIVSGQGSGFQTPLLCIY